MVPNHSARTRNNLRSSAGRAPAGNSSNYRHMSDFWELNFIFKEKQESFIITINVNHDESQ